MAIMAYGFHKCAANGRRVCSSSIASTWHVLLACRFQKFASAVGSSPIFQRAVLGSSRSVHSCGLCPSLAPFSLLLTGPSPLWKADFAECSFL